MAGSYTSEKIAPLQKDVDLTTFSASKHTPTPLEAIQNPSSKHTPTPLEVIFNISKHTHTPLETVPTIALQRTLHASRSSRLHLFLATYGLQIGGNKTTLFPKDVDYSNPCLLKPIRDGLFFNAYSTPLVVFKQRKTPFVFKPYYKSSIKPSTYCCQAPTPDT